MRHTHSGPSRARPRTPSRVARTTTSAPAHGVDPHAPLTRGDVLRLQETIGNSAVHRLLAVQRAPAVPRHKQRLESASPESYADLVQGLNQVAVAAGNAHGQGVQDVALGTHLSPAHLELLKSLRSSVEMAYSAKPGQHQAALNVWTSIQPDLSAVLRRAPEFVEGDVSAVQRNLAWVGDQVIRPAAYREAHQEAVAHSSLQAPDLGQQEARLEEAESELEQAKDFAEEGGKLFSEGAAAIFLKDADLGKEIFEMANLKGTITEKLEKAKEKGIVEQTATAIELVGKIAGLKNTIITTTMEYLKGRAEKMAEEAIKAGLKQVAHQWKELAEGYEKTAMTLKTVGKVLGFIGVVADAIRAIKAAINGDWEEAAKSAASAGMGVLGALGAEGSGAMLGAITITIKAEIEAIHLAAEFIRWCKEETVREAAGNFVDACSRVAKNVAFDFVADIDLALGGGNGQIATMAEGQINARAKAMSNAMTWLGQVAGRSEEKWPGMMSKLGPAAEHALSNPLDTPGDPLTVAQQVREVFAGANLMATYVKEHYPTDSEKAAARKKKEGAGAKAE
jgi:hypothetical protein